jgi:hypothetical protein
MDRVGSKRNKATNKKESNFLISLFLLLIKNSLSKNYKENKKEGYLIFLFISITRIKLGR